MFLMYIDESGDPGLLGSPSRYFALSGLTIHETKWHDFIQDTLNFRRYLRIRYGVRLRNEIHASDFIRSSYLKPDGTCLSQNERILVLRDYLNFLSGLNYLRITNIVIDKNTKTSGYDVFTEAWKLLFQRFENTLNSGNFSGSPNQPTNDYGIVFCDDTNGGKLTSLMRKMTVYNPIPNAGGTGFRNLPMRKIIEDPNMRDSNHSLLIQSADVVAYMLLQYLSPNKKIKAQGARNYFARLRPVLNTRASRHHSLGIVML